MRAMGWVFGAAALVVAACGSAADAQGPATIPLDMNAPRPTAQLTIGDGPPVTAIFDTGAAASVLRLAYAERLGLRREGPANAAGPGGTAVEGFRTTMAGALGEAQFDRTMAVALDIPLPLPGVDAVISPSVFSGRLVRFDFAEGVARVLPRTEENTPSGEALAYMGEDGHGRITRTPSVRVTLPNGESLIAMVDSGTPGAFRFPLAMASRLPLAAPPTPRDPIRLIGRELPAYTARIIGVVRVGPLELQDPEVVFFEGDGFPSIVGYPVLRQGVLVLDPGERRSWFLLRDAS